jgi:hypothetical protein
MVAVLAGLFGAIDANAATVSFAQVNRINWNSNFSQYGEVLLDITLSGSPEAVNVVADLNGDGTINDYFLGPDLQTEWIVRNMELPVNAGYFLQVASTFPLVDTSVLPLSTIGLIDVSFSPNPVAVPGVGTVFPPTNTVGQGDRLDPGGGKDAPIGGLTPDPVTGAGGYNNQFINQPPPLALTDFKYHFNVPDNNQPDGITCGPTSAANSLRWLAQKHGFNAKLPATDAQIINDLKSAGYMKTSNPDGTLDPDFVNGKQKYINDKKLPIVQKFKDGNTTINGQAKAKPDKQWVWDELKAGEDIEMGFTFSPGPGGHWVTLVGGAKWSDNTYYVYINDPGDREQRTKRYQLKLRGDGYLEMVGYGKGHFIDIVVSESFDDITQTEPSTWGRIKGDYR